jgi:hypothetical protein
MGSMVINCIPQQLVISELGIFICYLNVIVDFYLTEQKLVVLGEVIWVI